jgi:hemoglobin-like flavoprotein
MKFSTHPLSPAQGSRDFPTATNDLALAQRLRQSLAILLADGTKLAAIFYADLFAKYPQIRPMFRNDITIQQKKLTDTLEWVVGNLDRPHEVRTAARELGRKHDTYGAVAEHYPIVRDVLVDAMSKVAGDKWTRDLDADWRLAIDLLSALMQGKQG